MILTITLNPSVDISYTLSDGFLLDQVNRVGNVSKTAGGKGLNVARVLKQLNEDVAATGFLGGELARFIKEQIKEKNIHDYFIPIQSNTRNCIAILHEDKQTEILESGPTILASEYELFIRKLSKYAKEVKFITVSGSLPKGVPKRFYRQILTVASENAVPVLLDTKSELLKQCLEHDKKPLLIKPNESEIAELLGVKGKMQEREIEQSLQNPIFNGVAWIVVTLGSDGAIIKHGEQIYRVKIPAVEVMNPVGSGDAVIAGFVSGLSKGMTDIPLIEYGLTMGILNAMEEQTGYIDSKKIETIKEMIEIERKYISLK